MRYGFAKFMAAGAAAVVISACGGSGSTPSSPTVLTSGGTGNATEAITITITRQNGAQSFSPNPATAGGRLVVFSNADSVVHRVRLNDGSIDTGDIRPGAASQAVRMPGGGTNYHCSLHPDMVGSISREDGGGPPPCEGPYC